MIKIGDAPLLLEDMIKILYGDHKIELGADGKSKVERSYAFLQDFSKGKVIYGINTGFGPMAKYKIADADRKQLQLNLIRSHCSGAGKTVDPIFIKSMMVARLSTLMQGYSGIHLEALELLQCLINEDVYPVIYEHGGVGASGDLVQLAHLALLLIGEGEVFYKGEIAPAQEVMAKLHLQPMRVYFREGLALMNGTSMMSGIGIVNLINAKKLVNYTVLASCMINELVEAYDDHFSVELNRVKKHKGQNDVASLMRNVLSDSQLIKKRSENELYNKSVEDGLMRDKVQEYYSIRCVPQIIGPVLCAIENAEQVVVEEINSANDNPIIDAEAGNVFHGGNFHGDYVSFEMDKLKIAIVKLQMLMERQLNYLLNANLNNILPPFVNKGFLGFNFGIQGLQFTATSTVAESQTIGFPTYLNSIPNNNDNQDIVSMGTNAALLADKVIGNAFEVLSIHLITVVQAINYLKLDGKLSSKTKSFYKEIEAICPPFVEDAPKYKEIQQLKEHLMNSKLEQL